jgi:hypothetical protein
MSWPGTAMDKVFIYFNALPRGIGSCGDMLGSALATDQGWCKSCRETQRGIGGWLPGAGNATKLAKPSRWCLHCA